MAVLHLRLLDGLWSLPESSLRRFSGAIWAATADSRATTPPGHRSADRRMTRKYNRGISESQSAANAEALARRGLPYSEAHRISVPVDRLRLALEHEADYAPGWVLAYGRPHQYARARSFPRFSRTGDLISGSVTLSADCPAPIKGRCECKPDGSWRPVGGSLRADALAHHAEYRRTSEVRGDDGRYPGQWTDSLYVKGDDGLWRCTRPHRRAMDLLRGESLRRFLVLDRLLDGYSLERAWFGLGVPVDAIRSTLGIVEQVNQMAKGEAHAEYEVRPRTAPFSSWIDRSDSQRSAEEGAVSA